MRRQDRLIDEVTAWTADGPEPHSAAELAALVGMHRRRRRSAPLRVQQVVTSPIQEAMAGRLLQALAGGQRAKVAYCADVARRLSAAAGAPAEGV